MSPLPLLASSLLALAPDPRPALDLTLVAPIEIPRLKLRPEAAPERPVPFSPECWPGFPGLWPLGAIDPSAFADKLRDRNGHRRLIAPMPQVVGDENLDRRMPMKGPDPDVDYKILMKEVALAPAR